MSNKLPINLGSSYKKIRDYTIVLIVLQYGTIPSMMVTLPIPTQLISENHQAPVPATPRKAEKSKPPEKKEDLIEPLATPSKKQKTPKPSTSTLSRSTPRPKPANPGLAAGVAAITLDATESAKTRQSTANPSSTQRTKGSSSKNTVSQCAIKSRCFF